MPFYEYQCQACGAQTEVLQKITDGPLKKCPECGKSKLRKIMSAPVFRLKGGGWYETDFKTDQDKKKNLVETEKPESKADDKADAKVDAKPEAKADSKSESKGESKAEAKPEPKKEKAEPKAARSAPKKKKKKK
jgi:putative FmdB family regulatory protein